MADKSKKIPRFLFLVRTRDARGKTVQRAVIARRRNKKGK